MFQINHISITRSSMPPYDEFAKEIKDLWQTRWLTNMGEKHNALETALKKYLSVENVSLFCNGHLALELCLQAFELTGDVITTPFTFASTTNAIVRNGLRPVFCDVNETDFTIDVNKIEELITEKTSAILPVHVYGNICDIEKIDEISKRYNLKIIYDAAHAFGVSYNGVGVGNFGDAAMFSFHATKVFHTIEGGAICTSLSIINEKLRILKNFGITSEDEISECGSNAKMNEFSAIMGLCNLRYIRGEINKRKNIYELYKMILKDVKGLKLPEIQQGVERNYAYFPIIVNQYEYGMNRDELKAKLADNGIFTRKYFYPLTSSSEYFHSQNKSEMPIPVAKKISESVLTLPMYAELTETDVHRICSIIVSNAVS